MPGVAVSVDRPGRRATLDGVADAAAVKRAVERAGFVFAGPA